MTTFEEAFNETGHGRFNKVVLVTCGLLLLYTMMESLGIGYVITAAECDLGLTSTEKGMVNAAAFIGIFGTAIMWGYLSDRYGRRAVMLPAILIGSVVSFASSLSYQFWTFLTLRILTGCLLSASSATSYAYLGEMHSDAKRSSAIAYGSTFMALAFIVLPILGWLILSGEWSFHLGSVLVVPWRCFIWSWCTPGLLAASILLFLPESPRYLYSAKGQMAALPVLAKIYAWNHRDKKVEDYPIKSINIISVVSQQRGFCKAFHDFKQLTRAPLRRCILISHFSMFMVFMKSSGLYTWMPFVLNEMVDHIHLSRSMCDVLMDRYAVEVLEQLNGTCQVKKINPLTYLAAICMGFTAGSVYISLGLLMRKYSKISVYWSVLVLCCTLLLLSSVMPQPILGILFFIMGVSSGCVASVLAAISVEVFPTSVRALALCTLYMSGRLGAAVGANLIGVGLQTSCTLMICLISVGTAGSALLLWLWPDPKKVRTEMEGRGFAY